LADPPENPLQRPLPDGVVPEEVVARTESHWAIIMGTMLVVMMAVIVITGVAGALHPSSNVEVVDPLTLHLGGELSRAISARRSSPTAPPRRRSSANSLISSLIASSCRRTPR